MAKRKTTAANHTRSADGKHQLADLAALLGFMLAASKPSQDLDALANEVGGSLEKVAVSYC